MASIEAEQKVKDYLNKVGGSNLTEMWFATKIYKSPSAMKKLIWELEETGIVNIEQEYGGHYWITLKDGSEK